MNAEKTSYSLWKCFVVEKEEVSPEDMRLCILESWRRSSGIDPEGPERRGWGVLDVVSDEEIRDMKSFPQQGSMHSEKVIGTSGIGTSLAIDGPVQIHAEEHWLKDNHMWSCNSSPIRRSGSIVGCLNLSCPLDKSHEHSLGLIVASVNAIQRELELMALLAEKQWLIQQQNAVLELVDTGIILKCT